MSEAAPELPRAETAAPGAAAAQEAAAPADPSGAASRAPQSEPSPPASSTSSLSDVSDGAPTTESPGGAFDAPAPSADEQGSATPVAREGAAPDPRGDYSLNASTGADRAAEPTRADGPTGPASAQGQASPEAVERAERVLQQVRLQLRPDMRQATLELRPASLGRIAIQIEVADGEVKAVIRAERAETLTVLERHLPELRAMFQQSGMDVSDLDLGLGFEQQGESEFGDPQNEQRGQSDSAASTQEIERPLESALATRIGEMGVDTFA